MRVRVHNDHVGAHLRDKMLTDDMIITVQGLVVSVCLCVCVRERERDTV